MELVHTSKPDDDRKVVNINMKKNTHCSSKKYECWQQKKKCTGNLVTVVI